MGSSSVFFLIAGAPFGFGPEGLADEGSIRADVLMTPKDGREDPLNGASDLLVKQEKFFKPTFQDMNAIFEIGLANRRNRAGMMESGGRGGRAGIEFDVGAIGEEPVESDQNKVGEDLLFDAAFGPGVKVLNVEDTLANLIEFLDAPSAMVDVDELLERIPLGIDQGGAQAKYAVGDPVFEQS